MNYWDQVRGYLRAKVSTESYENWLNGTLFLGIEGNALLVSVPDQATQKWLETEYAPLVRTAIQDLRLPVSEVVYEAQVERRARAAAVGAMENGHDSESGASLLNPKFTFDSFVVGACNQFAHAAARSVATNPSRSYNPLFLYGGVGMGKTHLMHAIGRSLMDTFGSMRVIYTSSERFVNEMFACIRT